MAHKMTVKHEVGTKKASPKPSGKLAKESWGTLSMDKGPDAAHAMAKEDMQKLMHAHEVMKDSKRMKAAMDHAQTESKKISSLADLKKAMMNASDDPAAEVENAKETKLEKGIEE